MKKIIPELKALPFEVGKTYKTKFATGESFTISKIIFGKEGKLKGKVIQFEGVYEKAPHLGDCPLSGDRLYPESEPTGNSITMVVCPHCKKSFDENAVHEEED